MSNNDKDRVTAFAKDPFEFTIIGGSAIPEGGGEKDTDHKSRAEHPLYDARMLRPLLQADIDDVRKHGIHTPIKVRRNGPLLETVFGRKRIRLARYVKKHFGIDIKVPYLIVPAKNNAELLSLVISENEHRDEDTYADKAEKCRDLLQFGGTEEEARIAFRFDSVASVKNLLAFWDLDEKVQDALRKTNLNQTQALALKKLTRDEQVEQLDAILAETKATGKAVSAKKVNHRVKQKAMGTDTIIRPGYRVMAKVIKHEKADDLPEGFVLGLRYAMGDLGAKQVKGLTAILQELFVEE